MQLHASGYAKLIRSRNTPVQVIGMLKRSLDWSKALISDAERAQLIKIAGDRLFELTGNREFTPPAPTPLTTKKEPKRGRKR